MTDQLQQARDAAFDKALNERPVITDRKGQRTRNTAGYMFNAGDTFGREDNQQHVLKLIDEMISLYLNKPHFEDHQVLIGGLKTLRKKIGGE